MPKKSSMKTPYEGEVIDVDFSVGAVIPDRKVNDVHIEPSDISPALELGRVERRPSVRCGRGQNVHMQLDRTVSVTLKAADGLGGVFDSPTRTDGGES